MLKVSSPSWNHTIYSVGDIGTTIPSYYREISISQKSTDCLFHHGYILALESVSADTVEIIKQMRTFILYFCTIIQMYQINQILGQQIYPVLYTVVSSWSTQIMTEMSNRQWFKHRKSNWSFLQDWGFENRLIGSTLLLWLTVHTCK